MVLYAASLGVDLHCVSKNVTILTFAKTWLNTIQFQQFSVAAYPKKFATKYARLPTTPVYCADTVSCKNYDPLTHVYIVLKSVPFTVCNKFARCHPFW